MWITKVKRHGKITVLKSKSIEDLAELFDAAIRMGYTGNGKYKWDIDKQPKKRRIRR